MNVALNTGLKSLMTAQYVLDTIGHNIANANTRGYSRQNVAVSSAMPLPLNGLLVGNGVDADQIQRSVDSLLNRRILGQVSVGGGLESHLFGMSGIESLLGELDGQGIGDLMDDFFSSVSDLSVSPGDSILRSGVSQAAVALTARFNGLQGGLEELGQDTATEVGLRVQDVNVLASQVLGLNQQIASMEGSGVAANDLRDQRDVALEELSKLADTTVLEDSNGSVRVLIAGNTLVSSSRVYELMAAQTANGDPALKIEGANGFVPVSGGTIGGLLQTTNGSIPTISSEMDQLARSLILEINRVHSTGMPASGPFDNLTGSNRVQDLDGDGQLTDELLSNSGLPFDISNGSLYVNITEEATGDVSKHRIDISRTHTTVGDLITDLTAIDHIAADVDNFGRLSIVADGGFGFDFSARLDTNPDPIGTFGGANASLGTSQDEPFALSDGQTLDLTVPVGGASFTITLQASDFADIQNATAEELAAVVNADQNAQTLGLAAAAVDGHFFLKSTSEGSTAGFTLDGGTALGALGWNSFAGTSINGDDNNVDVEASGTYTGSTNGSFTFVPASDGTIGTTPGLTVDVFDQDDNLVATLDVGAGYQPGDEIDVAEGVKISFGLGNLSASQNDLFTLDTVADSDTTDVLVALGLNSLFTGTGAGDIAVRKEIELDPSLISSSGTGSSGDSSLLLDLLTVQDRASGDLGGKSFGQFYGGVVGNFGFDMGSTSIALEANDSLISSLETMRDQVSRVNVDEELVDLVKYEQAFAAASQFISTVNQLSDELLALI